MNEKFPKVIAVAAVSGGGKTTIATGLKTKLGHLSGNIRVWVLKERGG
jgi:adenylate kinase